MTNTAQPNLDPRAQRWGSVAKYLLLIFGFAILAPVFWVALGGLIGFIAFMVVLLITWMLKEPAFTAAANFRLKLIKSEVAKNPVETLQAEHLSQSKALQEQRAGLEDLNGACRSLDQAIDQLESEFPDSPELPQMREDQAELVKLLKDREKGLEDAYVTLGEFAQEIKRVDRLWQVSLAAARARRQSGLTEDEWMSKLKTQTAIDTVRTSLNTQLAALSSERIQAAADRALKGRAAERATKK